MNMETFVIPCKYSREVPIIFNCLKSIRKYHQDAEIIIVDPIRNATAAGMLKNTLNSKALFCIFSILFKSTG